MNRSNYKLAVTSKKQAKQFKQALLSVGERADSEYFTGDQAYPLELLFAKPLGTWAIGISNRIDIKRVTFKELLTLLVTQVDQPKPGLLDGKCAIQVNNEREFKLLMKHYSDRGWKWENGDPVLPIDHKTHMQLSAYNYNTNVMYIDKFLFNVADKVSWKIIPFSDFAAHENIKVPVLVMRSVDGVGLYEGDEYALARLRQGKWELESHNDGGNEYTFDMCPNVTNTDWINYRAFSTKEAAESWIAEQNKPKELVCKLFGRKTAYIKQDCIDIDNGEIMFTIYPSDLKDMLHIYKQAYA